MSGAAVDQDDLFVTSMTSPTRDPIWCSGVSCPDRGIALSVFGLIVSLTDPDVFAFIEAVHKVVHGH